MRIAPTAKDAAEQPYVAVAPLADGPLDLIGDVHGEWQALRQLLAHLGYDLRGEHRAVRRLVFVGDLCDRGPDSPAVIEFVGALVQRGLAQCVLGNHELNILRNERKPGNGWFFAEHPDHARPEFRSARRATTRDRDAIVAFIATLPVALERADLRVVHAVWSDERIAALRDDARPAPRSSLLNRYLEFEQQLHAGLDPELAAAERAERAQWGHRLRDRSAEVPLLPALARCDERYQMGNPLRVLTSGVERAASASFFASGKWRMVERVAWWDEYHEPTPTVIGHYWRWLSEQGRARYSRGEANLFGEAGPFDWLGPRSNVYCVDFSVGARYREIYDGLQPGQFTRLAALRWPEHELVFEDGVRAPLR